MSLCFFKQKTAYEMRISDWISDVCSSDLRSGGARGGPRADHVRRGARPADRRCRRRAAPAASAADRAGGADPAVAGPLLGDDHGAAAEIGRDSGRESVWQDV